MAFPSFGGPGGPVQFIQYTELVVGQNHPVYTDVVNRPLEQVFTASGIDYTAISSGSGFPGFSVTGHLHHVADIVDFPTSFSSTSLVQVASTQARNALTPTLNEQVFNIETGRLEMWNGTAWVVAFDATTNVLNVKSFGAKGVNSQVTIAQADINNHAGIWKGTYNVGDSWDLVGFQEAIYAAYGVPGSSSHSSANPFLNTAIFAPGGGYFFNRPLTLTHIVGANIFGAGMFATTITCTSTVPNGATGFSCNGVSYSQFSGFQLQQSAASANPTSGLFLLFWDGNSGGVDGWSSGSQGNRWDRIYFSGNGQQPNSGSFPNQMNMSYAIQIGGSQGSECLILGCHFIWFENAVATTDANALQVNVWGGNFSNCRLGGVLYNGGAGSIIGVGFQNALNGAQLIYNGYDIVVTRPANDAVQVLNCRSESLQFCNVANGGIRFSAKACNVYYGLNRWKASTAFTTNSVITGNIAATPDGAVWMATTGGTTGTVEPNWPTIGSGVTTDGSVTWTKQNNLVVNAGAGAIFEDCLLTFGQVPVGSNYKRCNFSRLDAVQYSSTLADSTPLSFEDCTVTLGGGPSDAGFAAWGLGSGSKHLLSGYKSPSSSLLWISNFQNQQFEAGFDYGDTARNILGVYGALGRKTPSGTNVSGTDQVIYGGLSTGNATPGAFRVRVAQAGASGATVNDAVDNLVVSPSGLSFGPAGSLIIRDFSQDYSYSPGAITNGSNATQTNSFYGILPGDIIDVATSVAVPAGVILQAQATAPDTVQLVTLNSSGSTQTPTAGRVRYNVRSRAPLSGVTGHTPAQDVSQFQTDMGGASDFLCMYDGRINVTQSSGAVTNWDDIAGSGGGKGPTLNVTGTGNPTYSSSQGLIIGNGTSTLSATSTAFDFSGTKTILFGVINVQASNSPSIVSITNGTSTFVIGNSGQFTIPSNLVVNTTGPSSSAHFTSIGAANFIVRGGYASLSSTSITVQFFDQPSQTSTITALTGGSSLLTLLNANSPTGFGISYFALLNVSLSADQISTYRSWATAKHSVIPG